MKTNLRLIWRNLKRKPRRLILTAAGVGMSLLIVCMLSSIIMAVQQFMERGGLNKIVGVADRYGDGDTPMPETHLNTIRQLAGVGAAVGLDFGKGTYHDNKDLIGLWGVDATEVAKVAIV